MDDNIGAIYISFYPSASSLKQGGVAMSEKWMFSKIIWTQCQKCGKNTFHELGHYLGRKGEKKICLRCYTEEECHDVSIKFIRL